MQVISRYIHFHPQTLRTRILEASMSPPSLSFSFIEGAGKATCVISDGGGDAG